MIDTAFVDTNVLVYAHDGDAGEKHATARNLLEQLWSSRCGALSPQVLQEFFVNVTRKIAKPIPKDTARLVVSTYTPWCVDMSATDIAVAFRIEDEAKISFWDALILAAAVRAGATRVLTEDLNAGQIISGVEVVNPFIERAQAR